MDQRSKRKIRNTLETTNSKITEAEDRISEIEDRMVEINESSRRYGTDTKTEI